VKVKFIALPRGRTTRRRQSLLLAAFTAVLAGLLTLPSPASARVWIGFGFPLFVGPPAYYYPPPAYYYPPPVYYPPPAYYPPPVAYQPPPPQYCETGATVCPMEHSVPRGSACYCTTAQGRTWGHAT
jgi:hypothetical protein